MEETVEITNPGEVPPPAPAADVAGTQGRVIWCEVDANGGKERHRVGVEFIRIADGHQDAIIRFIFAGRRRRLRGGFRR